MSEERKRRVRSTGDRYTEILEIPLSSAECMKHGLWQGATWGDAIAFTMVKAAANGNVQVAREIRESIEGRAPQRPPDPECQEVRVNIIHIGKSSSTEPPRPYRDIVKS
jgi:hypothetical protein